MSNINVSISNEMVSWEAPAHLISQLHHLYRGLKSNSENHERHWLNISKSVCQAWIMSLLYDLAL